MGLKIKKRLLALWDASNEFVARRFPRLAAFLAPVKAFLKKWVLFFRDVVNEFLTDNCPHLAASISFYVLLSLFPLTLALVSILGFIFRSPEMQARVIEGIANFLPISQEFITSSIESVVKTGTITATGIIGVIGLVIGGNAVFTAVRKSLNAAWGIREPRPFMTERLVELSMMLGAAILIFLSLAMTSALRIAQQSDVVAFGGIFWNIISALIGTMIIFVVFLFLYKFVPNTKVRWRDIWLGALLAAIGFQVTQSVFFWYATNFAHYNLIYGPIGSLIALLLWVYISAVIFLFCAKMTAVRSRKPAPTTEVLAKLWAAVAELRQRTTAGATEQLTKLTTAVAELEEHLIAVAKPTGKRKRGIGALIKKVMLRKTSQPHSNSGESATSSPREQPPR